MLCQVYKQPYGIAKVTGTCGVVMIGILRGGLICISARYVQRSTSLKIKSEGGGCYLWVSGVCVGACDGGGGGRRG